MFRKLIFAILLLLSLQLNSADWRFPYFIDTLTEGVYFYDWRGVQNIRVREELPLPFVLAQINYEGVGEPTMGSFDVGNKIFLGANITKMDGKWLITIEKRQDYENKEQQIYSFQIYIRGVTDSALSQYGILLTLENIFDNNPLITYQPSPCRVEELRANYLTNCSFTVYDPDGIEKNNIRLVVYGRNEANTFEFLEYAEEAPPPTHKTFLLRIKNELHYEQRAIYNLNVSAYDANNNSGSIFVIVEVIDVPNRDPVWVRPLTSATIVEKQEQTFFLKAIDGDTGINKPICYRLKFDIDYSNFISINYTSGELHIKSIDRDVLNQQIFTFLTCAYKCDNYIWAIENTTILIVQDINDHIPEITMVPAVLQILEAKYLTLPFNRFMVDDIDLGNNATYNVFFSTSPGGRYVYSDAFKLIPNAGYQHTNFSITVANTDNLDYENKDWRSFEITIVAQEVQALAHISNKTLKINLINWNDEWPMFQHEIYEIDVYENVTKQTFITQLVAKDLDEDDEIVYSIVGNLAGLQVAIDGTVTTSDDNVFDYEHQTLVMVQVQAKDTLVTEYSQVLHSAFAQLKINVLDVNDETPEIKLPRFIVNITENSPPLTLLTDKIEARDLDGNANIIFDILWNETYATKSGQEAETKYYVGCFVIESHAISKNLVYGHLSISPEFKRRYEVDYEMYDTIFLTIKVTDLNQEINENSFTAVLTVRIDDVNDNPPSFVVGTLKEPRKVTELANKLTVIGSIAAFDIDGPGNNIITYNIRPIGIFTEDGLVAIHKTTGMLRVNSSNIQCDTPKIDNLEYEIILTDALHTTRGNISISVIDINNQVPETEPFKQQVSIYENATSGYFVEQIRAHDYDRDAPHNILEYTINSATVDIHHLFQINTTNGRISVNLRDPFLLDRDHGIEYHYIAVDIKDNFNYNNPGYGPVNQRTTFLNVTLLDVNDNAPVMPAKELFAPEFEEFDLGGSMSDAQIKAFDIDEPNTANARVSYRILNIKPARRNAEAVKNYTELFDIVGHVSNVSYGQLRAIKDLRGYFGWWEIRIEAHDDGEPRMANSSVYEAYVRPFNFHAPILLYPVANRTIRICHALQEAERPLYQADCLTRVPHFAAFDPDGGEYGDVSFQLSSDSGDDVHFEVIKEGRNTSSLYLKNTVPAGIYYINVRATDGGGSSSEEIRNLRLVFVDMLGNAMFLEKKFTTNFTESERGLAEECFIPEAYDPRNEGIDEFSERIKLYYFIDESFRPDDAKLFSLQKETRLLRLRKILDREAIDTLHLRVRVSNNENGSILNPNSVNYMLDIVITVNDVNDNAPTFLERSYVAGVTLKDTIGKEILVFHAVDPDLDDPTTYVIDNASFITYGENIEQAKFELFSVNNSSGELTLRSYVTNNMKGYYLFDVMAYDTADPPHIDKVPVIIYIISEANRVKFVFLSDVQALRENEQFIREEFQKIYNYSICNIDAIEDATNQQQHERRDTSDGAFISKVIVHFINNNVAVEAIDIQKYINTYIYNINPQLTNCGPPTRRATDLVFISKLQNTLQQRNLILNDIPHLSLDEDSTPDDWLLITLIVISILLAVLSAILVAVLVIKTRILNRQLKSFQSIQFGSLDSNLSHKNAPTSNIFSIDTPSQGFKKFPTFDDHEDEKGFSFSSDSDSEEDDEFIGLQDDPMFDINIFTNNKKTHTEKDYERSYINDDFRKEDESQDVNEKFRY